VVLQFNRPVLGENRRPSRSMIKKKAVQNVVSASKKQLLVCLSKERTFKKESNSAAREGKTPEAQQTTPSGVGEMASGEGVPEGGGRGVRQTSWNLYQKRSVIRLSAAPVF